MNFLIGDEIIIDKDNVFLPQNVFNKYNELGITSLFSWQSECIKLNGVLDGSKNLVYSAPTSAGKTLVSEIILLKRVLELKKKVLFILPYVSVSKEKMVYFQKLFGGIGLKIGGFMGDMSPKGGLATVDIAVCTIEKANNLVNRLIDDGSLEELSLLVIDELHMLGDEHRGYILELLLTKILYHSKTMKENDPNYRETQIIGMSATLPNLNVVAQWLKAELYVCDYRPIPLQEMMKCDSKIYDCKDLSTPIRMFNCPSGVIKTDEDQILGLCLETILEGHGCLVFCPTKKWCETMSKNLAKEILRLCMNAEKDNLENGFKLRKIARIPKLEECIEDLKSSPSGLDDVLEEVIPYGVAFHHAGLTTDERDIIETYFREGHIKILIATSTLSSGVNLPARRVIIRTPLFNNRFMDPMTYRQMIGRAGRKGIDVKGESVIVCKPKDLTNFKKFIEVGIQPIKSCLDRNNSLSLKRALLEVIVPGVVHTVSECVIYLKNSFLEYTLVNGVSKKNESESEALIIECLEYLEKNDMIKIKSSESQVSQKKRGRPKKQVEKSCGNLENDQRLLYPTSLGQAVLSASIGPEDGLVIFHELDRARRCLALDTDLHLIYLLTPVYLSMNTAIDWTCFYNVVNSFSEAELRVMILVGIEEKFLIKYSVSGRTSTRHSDDPKYRRFYSSLILYHLVNEFSFQQVTEKFNVEKGSLQSLQMQAATYAGMVTIFCNRLGWSHLEVLMTSFQRRMIFGVSGDLVDLVRLSLMNACRARIFFKAGLETISSIAGAKVKEITNLLRKSLPFQSAKVGDHIEEMKYNSNNSDRILGPNGKSLKLEEAAMEMISESQMLLKRDLQLMGIEWNPPTLVKIDENISEVSDSNIPQIDINNSLNKSTSNDKEISSRSTINCEDKENFNPSDLSPYNDTTKTKCKIAENVDINLSRDKTKQSHEYTLRSRCEPRIMSSVDTIDKKNDKSKRLSGGSSSSITKEISFLNLDSSGSNSYETCETSICPLHETQDTKNQACHIKIDKKNPKKSKILSKHLIDSKTKTNKKVSGNNTQRNVKHSIKSQSLMQIQNSNCDLNNTLKDHSHESSNIKKEVMDKMRSSIESKNVIPPFRTEYGNTREINNSVEPSIIMKSDGKGDSNKMDDCFNVEDLSFSDDSIKTPVTADPFDSPLRTNSNENGASHSHIMKDGDSFELLMNDDLNTLNNQSVKSNDLSFPSIIDNKNTTEISPNSLKRSPIEMSTPIGKKNNKKLRFENLFDQKMSPLTTNEEDSEILVPNSQPMFKTPILNTNRKTNNRKTKNSSKNESSKALFDSVLSCMNNTYESELTHKDDSGDLLNCSHNSWKSGDDLFSDCEYDVESNKSSSLFSSIRSCVTSNSSNRSLSINGEKEDVCCNEVLMKPCLSTVNEVSMVNSLYDQTIVEVCKTRNTWNNFLSELESWKKVLIGDFSKKKIISITLAWKFDCNNEIELLGISIFPESSSSVYYLNLLNPIGSRVNVSLKRRSEFLVDLLSLPHFLFVSFDWIFVFSLLERKLNQHFMKHDNLIDVLLMDWMLNSENCCHTFLDICNKYNIRLNNKLKVPINNKLVDIVKIGDRDLTPSNVIATDKDAANQALVLLEICICIRKQFIMTWSNSSSLYKHFSFIEMNIGYIIDQAPGFGVNFSVMESQIKEVKRTVDILKQMAFIVSGKTFNIDSPKEVSKLLFIEMRFPVQGIFNGGKITRKNSTSKITASTKKNLNHLLSLHPLPGLILEYRHLGMLVEKTLNPLFEACKKVVIANSTTNPKIKCIYQQLSSTGRLNSTSPNLQSVPKPIQINWFKLLHLDKRDLFKNKAKELGIDKNEDSVICNFRSCFNASHGFVLVTADYRQLELRILSHFSCDPALIGFFINQPDVDIFIKMASKWLKKPMESITDVDRQQAKQISYGIIYGISAQGLSEQMSIEESKAEQMINEFMIAFPGVSQFIKSTIDICRKNGFIETITGRRRYLPDIISENPFCRSHAERQAIHSTIQGSAADIVKTAMVMVDNAITADYKNKSFHRKSLNQIPAMVLHLHDEILYEVPLNYMHNMAVILKQCMEKSYDLKVSLPVKVKTGTVWSELNDFIV